MSTSEPVKSEDPISQLNKSMQTAFLGKLKNKIQEKLIKLRLKLEQVDTHMIDYLQLKQNKRAVTEQYFKSLGKLTVLKIANKGIEFKNLFDYFVLDTIK